MNDENILREKICLLAKSMYDRGLTGGSTGNISVSYTHLRAHET